MSSINYCTLDEAWGKSNVSASSNCNIYSQHKKQFEKDNPLKTPNVNYQCSRQEESNNNQIELSCGFKGGFGISHLIFRILKTT